MQAQEFIRKWAAGSPAHALGERAGAQAHFIDLCRVLGVPEPGDPERYGFERGVGKTGSAGMRTRRIRRRRATGDDLARPGLDHIHPRR
ncbi:MAG: hypothetical protein KGK09_10145 [Burkholderiales bacterium]|nr:hypothetical protein [Burkholderiales bacterium]